MAAPGKGRVGTWLRRTVWLAVVAGVLGGTVYLARRPILTWIGGQLIRQDALEKSDAIVVLAGGVPDRELEAADLYREGYAPRILLPHDPEPAGIERLRRRGMTIERTIDLRVRILTTLGVPADAITILPPEIESTDAESRAVFAWASANQVRSFIVVTSSFHTGRARLTYLHFAPKNIRVLLRAARIDTFTPSTWWHTRTNLRNGLFEWQKQIYYRLRY